MKPERELTHLDSFFFKYFSVLFLAVVKKVDEPGYHDDDHEVSQYDNVAKVIFDHSLCVPKGTNFDRVLDAKCLYHYHGLWPTLLLVFGLIFEFVGMSSFQAVWPGQIL